MSTRPKAPGRPRAGLLEPVADFLLDHGLAELSLRPLAAAIGTSPRMLIYHFGSKERLIDEALQYIDGREREEIRGVVEREGGGSALVHFWKWTSAPERRAFLALRHEVSAMRQANPEKYDRLRMESDEAWMALIEGALVESGVARAHVSALSHYLMAFVAGCESLLLDGVEKAEADRAFAMFVEDLERRADALRAPGG